MEAMSFNIYGHTPIYEKKAMHKSTQERILGSVEAAKVAQRLERLERTTSAGSGTSDHSSSLRRLDSKDMEFGTRAKASSIHSTGTTASSMKEEPILQPSGPFISRYGRRYLRDLPYPLPCDLPELQRQNLRTILSTTAFGKALCSPSVRSRPPKKVLEVGCGSGYWSSLIHDYFVQLGYPDVSFTGIDIVSLAPDFAKQGMKWNFVQHDLRRVPLPFGDEEFDLVILKDVSLVLPIGSASQRLLDDNIRILKKGGTIEFWESDHLVRSILPHPPPPPGKSVEAQQVAMATGTFLISPGTPFTNAQNKYLQQANQWIQEALGRRKLEPTPCARVAQMLFQEPDTLGNVGYHRFAIPFGDLRWEREGTTDRASARRRESETGPLKDKGKHADAALSPEQSALRYTALLTTVQMIESLEPLLKEVSQKNQEEWQRWWASMMNDLLDQKGAASGECLEFGAWWATKL